MIPDNSEELSVLAGEYVLGVLDAHESGEVAAALAINAELRHAVAFWEERFHPLSSLAASPEPPPDTWQAIEARIRTNTTKPVTKSLPRTAPVARRREDGGGPSAVLSN